MEAHKRWEKKTLCKVCEHCARYNSSHGMTSFTLTIINTLFAKDGSLTFERFFILLVIFWLSVCIFQTPTGTIGAKLGIFIWLGSWTVLVRWNFGYSECYGLFYDQGTRSVSFVVKNNVFQIWGKIWNALILVDNNVFVLQVTQSINPPQIWRHHVFRFTFYNMSNFMFSERTYFDGTPTSKIWLCGTEKLKGQLQSFYPKCLELGWEFINKIPLIILFI